MENKTNSETLQFIPKIRDMMHTHNFMFSYRGRFTQSITKSILSVTEKRLEIEKTETSTKKKVFNIMVECLQNICKHIEKADNTNSNAIFMIGKQKEEFIIYSGNTISNDKISGLQNKLTAINSMSREELKVVFGAIISGGDLSESGGAGLGLIDIAKKSGSKLEYNFEKIDEQISFFSLKTSIKQV